MDHHWKKRGIFAACLPVCCVLVLAVALLASCSATPDTGDTPPSPPVANEPESPQEPTQQEPIPVVIQSTFGFADQDGRTLLLPSASSQPEDPEALDTAIGTYGTILPIVYAGQQEGTAQDSGRMTADNFPNIPGSL